MDSNFWHFERAAEGRRDQVLTFRTRWVSLVTCLHMIRTVRPYEQICGMGCSFLIAVFEVGLGQTVACLCFVLPLPQPVTAPSSVHHMQPLLQPATAQPSPAQPSQPLGRSASAAFSLCSNLPPPKQRPPHASSAPSSHHVVPLSPASCIKDPPPAVINTIHFPRLGRWCSASLAATSWPADRLAERADPPAAEPQPQPQLHLGARA
jgi:hypothetical protein